MAVAVGGRVGVVLGASRDLIVTGYLAVTASLILAGVLQWLLLRRLIADTAWWVPANTSGLVLAIPVVGFVTWATGAPADDTFGAFFRWLAFCTAYGIVTGTALWRLLRERHQLATA
jgi:hypothetical protein